MTPTRFRNTCRIVPLVLVLIASAASLAAQSGFYLRDNDTVVFYGDSITEQRLYTTFVETFIVTRYPQLKVETGLMALNGRIEMFT